MMQQPHRLVKQSFLPLLFTLTMICACQKLHSQDVEYDKIPVKTAEDCKKAEPKILEAANLVLATPLHSSNTNVPKARSLIMAWMSNTADYTFTINDKILKLTKSNELLFGLYLSCMAKYALENPDKAKDEKNLQIGSYTYLANYVEVAKNGVESTKAIQKFLEARKSGKLEEYIGK